MKIIKKIDPDKKQTTLTIATWNEREAEKIIQCFDDRVRINTTKGIRLMKRSDVIYVEALRNYLKIHTTDHIDTLRLPLYKIKEILGEDFIQVSRSYLINYNYLTAVEADFVNGMVARVAGLKIPISRTYLKNLYDRMEEEK